MVRALWPRESLLRCVLCSQRYEGGASAAVGGKVASLGWAVVTVWFSELV